MLTWWHQYYFSPILVSPYHPVILQESSPHKQWFPVCLWPFLSIRWQDDVASLPNRWLTTSNVSSLSEMDWSFRGSERLRLLSVVKNKYERFFNVRCLKNTKTVKSPSVHDYMYQQFFKLLLNGYINVRFCSIDCILLHSNYKINLTGFFNANYNTSLESGRYGIWWRWLSIRYSDLNAVVLLTAIYNIHQFIKHK